MQAAPEGTFGVARAWPPTLLTVLLAAAVAATLDRWAPHPSADVRRGSEGAFTTGLEPREIEAGVVQRRWAKGALTVAFAGLPEGPLQVEVVVRGHRHDVFVQAGGALLGSLPPGRSRGTYELTNSAEGRLQVTLCASTFEARERRLAFMFERVSVKPSSRPGGPPLSLLLLFVGPALATLGLARWSGAPWPLASAAALGSTLLQAAVLLPEGLLRSPYADRLAWLIVLGAAFSALVVRALKSGETKSTSCAAGFAALLLATWVQGLLATHPMLVTSDAVFHANKVRAASEGAFFPVSLTPHDPPYRFPYGVSFHLLLVPFTRVGADPESAVVVLASLTSLAAAAAFFWALLPRGGGWAALVTALSTLLPVTFSTLSAGNHSNVFAQALTLLFLAWALHGRPFGFLPGAVLVALAATAHFGAFLVLFVLGPALLWTSPSRGRDRPLLLAVGAGLLGATLYYLPFLGMMTAPFERLVSGAGAGRDLVAAALQQGRGLLRDWGWPALLACAWAAATAARGPRWDIPSSLRALLVTTGVLGLLALLSPLEVRYLYAGAPAMAFVGALGLSHLAASRAGRILAVALVLAQAGLLARVVVHGLLYAYRP